MSLNETLFLAVFNGEDFSPEVSTSKKFKHWVSLDDEKRCFDCGENHGKIWGMNEPAKPKPPMHPWDRCKIQPMQAIKAGTATSNNTNGADWSLKHKGLLPEYYITPDELESYGWRNGKKVSKFVSGKMLFGGIYDNDNLHLPQKPGRIWYEADINYTGGKRKKQRIVWSNDGLIFVTYDHYETFYEII